MKNQSSSIQRQKIHSYLLKHGSATTIQIRHELDIMMPAARIHELRHDQGLNITTAWDDAINPEGSKHRVARYFLKQGKYQGVKQ